MPLIFRSMTRDGDQPSVGAAATTLGVRLPPDPHADVHPDGSGEVHPGGGGMSVAPDWRRLPSHRIPKRLRPALHGDQDARGKENLYCWRMGEGPFERAPVSDELQLAPDQPDHGVVEPSTPMPVADFQGYLAATRGEWKVIPEDPRR